MTPTARRALAVGSMVAAVAIVAAVLVAAMAKDRQSTTSQQTDLERLGDYGVLPPFSLVERSGRRVGLADLRGSVSVVDFIYTQCTDTCPAQSLALARLQGEFADDTKTIPSLAPVRLVSISVDPEHDTPAVLRRYAERYGASDRWWFLTGDKRDVYCLAKDGFRLSVIDLGHGAPACGPAAWLSPTPAWAHHDGTKTLMHSARAVLLDGQGRIRAYHPLPDPDALRRLADNVRQLRREPAPSR